MATADSEPMAPAPPRRRLAVNTAFFSFATGLSRVVGLVREVVAANYFGVTGAMSAFTIAFQFPNLIRALFADAALQGAFVPVFTELLEKDKRKEAFRLASSLILIITLVLGSLTLIFFLAAPVVMPLFAPGLSEPLQELTTNLARLMFPIVLLLALSGVTVGMLNSFEHFAVPALAPVAWNLVIISCLVFLRPAFADGNEIYAYAVGVLAGTVVQLLLPLPWLRGRGGRFTFTLEWNEHVKQVLLLMLPVTIALGLINFSLLINSFFGTLVSDEAPAAIDRAFRIYMLPQGLFSVAIATILFPTLSRFATRGDFKRLRETMANGLRQICLLLIPSAVILAVLADPITRLVYQRGAFDTEATDLVSTALFWWSFSLPFQGISLLFSRSFFSLQRPWATTALAGGNLVVNIAISFAFYKPFGVAGVVIGTVVATIAMALAQGWILRGMLGGIDGAATASAGLRILAASAGLGVVAYAGWRGLDELLGASFPAQLASVGGGIFAGGLVYAFAVYAMRVREAEQIWSLLTSRMRRNRDV
ncbi:MAG: murein biosynthesis integral membrane protein MurJ [Thermoleophilaceae bacterium]|nr:murein biosynthesis integral membrane protein MurJ [Thermoleophilaceae bacterium]